MFKSILVAVDGSDHARKAADIAADIASLYDAKLSLVHVVTGKKIAAEVKRMAEVEHLVAPLPSAPAFPTSVPDEMGRMLGDTNLHGAIAQVASAVGQRILDEVASRLHEAKGIAVGKHLEHGDPTRLILACAENENADLIVMGNRGLSDLEGAFMGSVSSRVTHTAKCTCLAVK